MPQFAPRMRRKPVVKVVGSLALCGCTDVSRFSGSFRKPLVRLRGRPAGRGSGNDMDESDFWVATGDAGR